MLFIFILFLAFGLGIWVGKGTAELFSPPSIAILTFLSGPWIFLYFFSEYSIVSDIQDYYLSFLLGIFYYWTYYQIKVVTRK